MYTTQGKLVEKFTSETNETRYDIVFPIRQHPTIITNPRVKEEISLVDIFNPILTNIEATSLDITAHQEQLHDAIDVVNNIIEKHPINCQVSPWSPCNKPCSDTGGPGMKYRTITQQAVNGGERCPILNVPCNTQACPVPIDCVLSEWSECNQPCTKPKTTPGIQTRKIVTRPAYNGKACLEKPEDFVRTCNTQACPSPVNCIVSPWTECSQVTNQRTRKIITPSEHGGISCPPLSEYCYPVNCVLSEWSDCSKPCANTFDKSDPGIQTRTILQHPNELGKVCPYPSQLTRQCNTQSCNLPFNCNVSDWSTCSKPCGGGTRSRTIIRQAAHGGLVCPTPKELTQSCNTQECRKDCQVGAWGNCSTSCGGGVRYREITVQPVYGGTACLPLKESCNSHLCQWQIDEQRAAEQRAAEQRVPTLSNVSISRVSTTRMNVTVTGSGAGASVVCDTHFNNGRQVNSGNLIGSTSQPFVGNGVYAFDIRADAYFVNILLKNSVGSSITLLRSLTVISAVDKLTVTRSTREKGRIDWPAWNYYKVRIDMNTYGSTYLVGNFYYGTTFTTYSVPQYRAGPVTISFVAYLNQSETTLDHNSAVTLQYYNNHDG